MLGLFNRRMNNQDKILFWFSMYVAATKLNYLQDQNAAYLELKIACLQSYLRANALHSLEVTT